jgi:putative heme-binding domain-containing protein
VESALSLVASLGDPKDLTLVFDLVVDDKSPADRRAGLLAVLERAGQQRQVRPAGDLARVGNLLDANSDTLRAAAARAAGLWRIEALRPRLLDLARSSTISESLRQAAFDGLVRLRDKTSRAAIEEMASASHPLAVRRQAVVALTELDLVAAARHAGDVLSAHRDGADPSDLFNAFLQRKLGAAALAAALAGRKLPADVCKVGVRLSQTAGRTAPALLETLRKAGSLTGTAHVLSSKEMKQIVLDVGRHGDSAQGERIFRRKDQLCLKCHAIAGAGGQVGPDLSSIGASAPVDYLIESILVPNKAVKENYHAVNIATRDGRLVTGIPVRQTDRDLILRDAEDRQITIPLKSIEAKEQVGSLMPEGLADTLTRGELIDLVRFLSELGKVGPYSVSKARLVRRWQALEPTKAARDLLESTSFASAASDDSRLVWSPAYSTVAGGLPPDDLPRFDLGTEVGSIAFVRCHLDASTAGKAKLLFNFTRGLSAWLDRVPLEVKEESLLDLATGSHTLTLAVDLRQCKAGLRIELEDVPGSPAHVRLIAGK